MHVNFIVHPCVGSQLEDQPASSSQQEAAINTQVCDCRVELASTIAEYV